MDLRELIGQVASVQDVLALENLAERVGPQDIVYLSGSRVDGTGNVGSDADIYVVSDMSPLGGGSKEGDTSLSHHRIGSLRVDFEFWSQSAVDRVRSRISDVDLFGSVLPFDRLPSYADLVFLHRLTVGLPLLNGDDLEALKGSFDLVKALKCRAHLLRSTVEDALEDLNGMIASRDTDVALFRVRDLLCLSLDWRLAAAGNLNPNPKWRLKILNAMIQRGEPKITTFDTCEFWSLMYPDLPALRADERLMNEYFTSAIRLCSKMMDSSGE